MINIYFSGIMLVIKGDKILFFIVNVLLNKMLGL